MKTRDVNGVVVDPVRCSGHGICALMLPERVDLDRWGYPIVDTSSIASRRVQRQARRAARACPRKALVLTARDDTARRSERV